MLSGCHGYPLASLPCTYMESPSLTIRMEKSHRCLLSRRRATPETQYPLGQSSAGHVWWSPESEGTSRPRLGSAQQRKSVSSSGEGPLSPASH